MNDNCYKYNTAILANNVLLRNRVINNVNIHIKHITSIYRVSRFNDICSYVSQLAMLLRRSLDCPYIIIYS